MEQHPVPQNISSYQFHLVGDMTLKQFLEVGGGVLVGVLIYALGLPGIIKWPLILISAGIGAALAFVPIEERPLEQWVFAFFRSIYAPTLYHWEKKVELKYFQDESTPITPSGESKSAFSKIPFLNKLEESENKYLSKLTQIFNPTAGPNLMNQTPSQNITDQPTVQPQITPDIKPSNIPTVQMKKNIEGRVLTDSVLETNPTPTGIADRKVSVPQTTFISLSTQNRPQIQVQEVPGNFPPVDLTQTKIGEVTLNKEPMAAKQAIFSTQAAPPSVPTIPNTVSGQVMDVKGGIVEGVILTIFDEAGRPVRALKTNKAGHFIIVTALANGKYKLLSEKEGFSFDPIEFEAKGDIIEPIAIKAKG